MNDQPVAVIAQPTTICKPRQERLPERRLRRPYSVAAQDEERGP